MDRATGGLPARGPCSGPPFAPPAKGFRAPAAGVRAEGGRRGSEAAKCFQREKHGQKVLQTAEGSARVTHALSVSDNLLIRKHLRGQKSQIFIAGTNGSAVPPPPPRGSWGLCRGANGFPSPGRRSPGLSLVPGEGHARGICSGALGAAPETRAPKKAPGCDRSTRCTPRARCSPKCHPPRAGTPGQGGDSRAVTTRQSPATPASQPRWLRGRRELLRCFNLPSSFVEPGDRKALHTQQSAAKSTSF